MKKFFLLLVVLQLGVVQADPLAYITDFSDDAVIVVDLADNSVSGTIGVGAGPFFVTFTPDGQTALVSNLNDGTVSVIDVATEAVTTIPVGGRPKGVSIAPDGIKAYVAVDDIGVVRIIDLGSNSVSGTIMLPVTGDGVTSVAISPLGTIAYASYGGVSGSVVGVIDVATNTEIGQIPVGDQVSDISFTPNGQKAYVTNMDDNTVSVIDVASSTVTTVPVGPSPFGVAVSADGTKAYVCNSGNTSVSVLNVATNVEDAVVPVGSSPFGVAAFDTSMYVVNGGDSTMSQINVADNNVVATSPIGGTFLTSIAINAPVAPPGGVVTAECGKNKFLAQEELFAVIKWESELASVIRYNIFRDGVKVGSVLADLPNEFVDHNLKKGQTYTYEVISSSNVTVGTVTITCN